MMPSGHVGPEVVYEPGPGETHELDIVFVHGLFGHKYKTFTYDGPPTTSTGHQTDGSTMPKSSSEPPSKKLRIGQPKISYQIFWPRDLLPRRLPRARIITWGYNVQIESMFSSGSKSTIFQHSQDLLSDLVMLRSSTQRKARPIIFIVHSLGGIVVKDALSISQQEQNYNREILPATKGVIFLGTPHHGSAVASIGKLALEMSKLFFQNPNTDVLRGLERNSEILDRIARSFGHVLATGQIKVHSFREELDTKGLSIVDTFSSSIGYLYETTGSLYANHRDMAKIPSCDDINFQRIVAVIDRWLGDTERPLIDLRISKDNGFLPDGLIFDEDYCDCLASLNSAEARMRHESLDNAYSGTFQWIFDSNHSFSSFLSGDPASNTYWIQGKPGSGKSTLMKFALRHPHTMELLKNYHDGPWIVAAYFFHDRGTDVQKSILGFVREILFQVLLQQRLLFPLVHSQFQSSKSPDPELRFSQSLEGSGTVNSQYQKSSSINWTLNLLEEALISIANSSNFNIGLCVFVDALDEHSGNHRDLIKLLQKLSQPVHSALFRIRVCMAGRPENVFKDAFRACPGFAMQDLTADDIQHYTEERFRQDVLVSMTEDGKETISELVTEIIRKAEGVFLWVRLVCDEFVESLCEGDTVDELKHLLSAIPTELEELYTRALRRSHRSQLRALVQTRYERYVMFQIVRSCQHPFSPYRLLSASLYLTVGKSGNPDLRGLSQEQMHRRLHSRSAGLLEVATSGKDKSLEKESSDRAHDHYSADGVVQFIHQTVKDYMDTDEGSNVMAEDSSGRPQEYGQLLIFRYLISLFPSPEYQDVKVKEFVIRDFPFYAHWVEHNSDYVVSDLMVTAIPSRLRGIHQFIMRDIIAHNNGTELLRLCFILSSYPLSHSLFCFGVLGLEKSVKKLLKVWEMSICYKELEALLIVLIQGSKHLESRESAGESRSAGIAKTLQAMLQATLDIHLFEKLPPTFDKEILALVSRNWKLPLVLRELLWQQWIRVRGSCLTVDPSVDMSWEDEPDEGETHVSPPNAPLPNRYTEISARNKEIFNRLPQDWVLSRALTKK